ncbi:uncharacterized protein VTP21DRAFT_5743 [Calcarisporiella thermophila]|uniref:uncharacterized protein n=1 Tax=Calcarisporiella thermophila TaxID=911321 RepID=UPI0037436187
MLARSYRISRKITQLFPLAQLSTSANGENRRNLNKFYDIVIVGGGIVGTSLACALASSPTLKNLKIALLEAGSLSKYLSWTPSPNEYSNRVSSLTPASVKLFQDIGVWNKLDLDRVQPYPHMHVWDGLTNAHIHFNSQLVSGSNGAIAWMVENLNMQRAAIRRLEELGGSLEIIEGSKVEKVQLETEGEDTGGIDWPNVYLEGGRKLKTRLLVGADGINSPVRSFAQIESLGWNYDAMGVVATLQVDAMVENNTAWQRFLPSGPIAMLPLKNGYSSLVWSTTPAIATKIRSLPPADFCHLVNAAFRLSWADIKYFTSHAPNINTEEEYAWRSSVEFSAPDAKKLLPPLVTQVQDGTRAAFPLKMRNSERYVTDRVALVGDAAHTVHPLAGQGLNQGLGDVSSLSRVVEQGVLDGSDIGNVNVLTQYSSERYLANLAILGVCDKLYRLYGTEFGPVVWARSLGLSGVNSFGLLKSEIMQFAMGLETLNKSRI